MRFLSGAFSPPAIVTALPALHITTHATNVVTAAGLSDGPQTSFDLLAETERVGAAAGARAGATWPEAAAAPGERVATARAPLPTRTLTMSFGFFATNTLGRVRASFLCAKF